MKHSLLALSATAILLGNSVSVQAGEFTLGAGAATFKAPYTGFKDDSAGLLFAEYAGEDLTIGTEGIDYRLLGDDESPWNLSATLTSVGMGFDSGDSAFFTGMADRDTSIDLGVSVDYQLGSGFIGATLVHDISSTHEGFVAELEYGHPFELANEILFVPTAGISYLSEDYTDYYYGVRAGEATASRAAYKADAAVTTSIGYQLMVPLTENWQLFHSADYTWLGDEISDSTIVNRDNVWSATLGVTYTF